MTLFSPTGDPLEGSYAPPSVFPAPQDVNAAPIDSSVGDGNPDLVSHGNVPSALSSTANDSVSVSLTWTTADGAVSYNVYNGPDVAQTGIESSYVTVTDLSPATAYSFTVTAVDEDGNESAASNAVSVTTNP